jgi:hypothetical protein
MIIGAERKSRCDENESASSLHVVCSSFSVGLHVVCSSFSVEMATSEMFKESLQIVGRRTGSEPTNASR